MKKNIQINLYGTLYNIDEDAYQLLENYLESMKRYFRKQEGGEEIADDIEHRVAELLWAKKELGMQAIDIDAIKEIMSQIGKAEEIGGTESASAIENEDTTSNSAEGTNDTKDEQGNMSWWQRRTKSMEGRRLYRDTQNKVLGGVCSGLAHYFNAGDPVFWRLGLILLALLLDGSGILLYLILWIIVPEARTSEDRLKMYGRPVNQENLNDQIISDNNTRSTGNGTGRGCLIALFLAVFGLPLLFAMFIIICVVVPIIFGLGIGGAAVFAGTPLAFLQAVMTEHSGLAMGGLVCVIGIIALLLYLLIHAWRGKKRLSASALTVIISLILLCFIGASYCISNCIGHFADKMENMEFKFGDVDDDDEEEADSDTIYCEPADTLYQDSIQ